MQKNPVNKGMIARNSDGIGTVSNAMIHKRAKELALISGRNPPVVLEEDLERAARELAGGSELDQQEKAIEDLPESKRWDPVPGSEGVQAPEVANEDEDDDEGRNESAQLIEEGVHEAEHDQMLEAEKAARKSERGGT
jgi:hypothetical protein